MAKIKLGAGTPEHDCLVIDISDDGMRLNVGGSNVTDEIVLLLFGDGISGKSHRRSRVTAMNLALS